MNPSAVVSLPETSFALLLVLLSMAPLALAGVALVNTGLGRSRSAAQSLLGSLVMMAVAVIAFGAVGAAFAAGPAGADHALHAGGRAWDVLGAGSLVLGGFGTATDHTQLGVLFEFFGVAMVALIPWGSGADRWRLAAGAASAAILSAVIYPVIAHWVWGGGWLAQLGTQFSLGAGFLDGSGAAVIHVTGGLSALAVVWITGSRKGKFPKEGLSTAMPGHNAVYILFGCLLALVGWLAWNMAGALLWLNVPPVKLTMIAIGTLLSACGALVATFAVTRIRFGKPDASLCANGWLAGLVASCAGAGLLSPRELLCVGLVAGIATPLMVEALELAFSIDDPSGAITVHGTAGIWGLIAVGLFSSQPGQVIAQLLGIAALVGLALPVVYLLFWLLNRVVRFRVDPDGERLGMDLHELGGGAYPEFVVHRDDSYR